MLHALTLSRNPRLQHFHPWEAIHRAWLLVVIKIFVHLAIDILTSNFSIPDLGWTL